ncbi:Probable oligopeptide ABC transporter, permease protein [Mycobacteroides abscessus subsp. massiliense]|nr:Probable oligopeptide ABC transporter, permease protein [Mycobacteroides abscessus subsp. massiliense]
MGRHAFRNSLVPVVTVMGMQIAMLLAGAVLTETAFEWNGLGSQLAHYLSARDFVAVQGIVTVIAIIVAVMSFVIDVVVALIDPACRVWVCCVPRMACSGSHWWPVWSWSRCSFSLRYWRPCWRRTGSPRPVRTVSILSVSRHHPGSTGSGLRCVVKMCSRGCCSVPAPHCWS